MDHQIPKGLQRTRYVFLNADLVTIRLLLATASLLYVLMLAFDQQAFGRPGYRVMASFGPWWSWAVLFGLHGVGAYWRIFATVPRPGWALAINTLGFAVWTLSTLCTNLSIGQFTPSTAMEWTMCAFSGWALARTGINRELLPA